MELDPLSLRGFVLVLLTPRDYMDGIGQPQMRTQLIMYYALECMYVLHTFSNETRLIIIIVIRSQNVIPELSDGSTAFAERYCCIYAYVCQYHRSAKSSLTSCGIFATGTIGNTFLGETLCMYRAIVHSAPFKTTRSPGSEPDFSFAFALSRYYHKTVKADAGNFKRLPKVHATASLSLDLVQLNLNFRILRESIDASKAADSSNPGVSLRGRNEE